MEEDSQSQGSVEFDLVSPERKATFKRNASSPLVVEVENLRHEEELVLQEIATYEQKVEAQQKLAALEKGLRKTTGEGSAVLLMEVKAEESKERALEERIQELEEERLRLEQENELLASQTPSVRLSPSPAFQFSNMAASPAPSYNGMPSSHGNPEFYRRQVQMLMTQLELAESTCNSAVKNCEHQHRMELNDLKREHREELFQLRMKAVSEEQAELLASGLRKARSVGPGPMTEISSATLVQMNRELEALRRDRDVSNTRIIELEDTVADLEAQLQEVLIDKEVERQQFEEALGDMLEVTQYTMDKQDRTPSKPAPKLSAFKALPSNEDLFTAKPKAKPKTTPGVTAKPATREWKLFPPEELVLPPKEKDTLRTPSSDVRAHSPVDEYIDITPLAALSPMLPTHRGVIATNLGYGSATVAEGATIEEPGTWKSPQRKPYWEVGSDQA